MIAHLKTWWKTYSTIFAGVAIFLAPSVQAWISAHPSKAASIGLVWALILHWAQSPISKN